MAELTADKLVPVEYCALPGANLRRRLQQLDPCWRILIAVALLCAAFFGGCSNAGSLLGMVILFAVALTGLAGLGVMITRDQIYIGEHGLSFPLPFMLALSFRPTRLWTELAKIEVLSQMDASNSLSMKGSSIRLTFRTGEQTQLRIGNFTQEGINLFVGAAAEWATHCKFDEQFEQLPKLYEYETGGFKSISYTQFWEEQLANTYTFTAFVPLQIGHRLRNETLTVLSQIASGGFSAIYLVKSADGNRMVVKESVTPGTLDDAAKEKITEQFKREAALLVKLDHPAIAQVYDHFVESGRSYLLIEYIQGPDLRAYIRQHGPQPEETVSKWFDEIARVLDYLHTQDPPIVHRDISPENLIVTGDGGLVLIDFGAANEFIGQATGTLVGKQSYISPEQIRGKACPQSDIYSLGATIYFASTGEDPEPLSCCSPVSGGAAISSQLDGLVSACTKLDLTQRTKSAAALLTSLCHLGEAVHHA